MSQFSNLAFTQSLVEIHKGTRIKPLLTQFFSDGTPSPSFWPRYAAKIALIADRRQNERTHFDGWFHPSSHPLLPERLLWWLLKAPDDMIPEHLKRENLLSINVGVAMHAFIETALEDLGILVGSNVPFSDEASRSRGEADGVTSAPIVGFERQIFEFKTSNQRAIDSIDDLDLEKFKIKWPDYYAQVQEYMRLSGLRMAVVIVMAMGYPWMIREFQIPYDDVFAEGVGAKYRRVLSLETMPYDPCCTVNSKTHVACPARNVCPVGVN